MITVYGYPNTRSTRITWMMEELGKDYEFSVVNLLTGEGRSSEYQAINPGGKVPAIKDDDLILTESGAIITYLGDKFQNCDLVPEPGTHLRGQYQQWCYFVLCELEQPLWTMGKHKFAIPEQYRVKEIFPTAVWELEKAMGLFSKGLGDNDYIVGNRFTAADILLTHTLNWATAFEQTIGHANLEAYQARNNAREALSRARAKEKAALESLN